MLALKNNIKKFEIKLKQMLNTENILFSNEL